MTHRSTLQGSESRALSFPMTTSRRAFTLIELLVVISIIALLVSILLPALGKARLAAQSVRCLSNQHQLFMGVAMYNDQYKEWMPIGGYNSGTTFKASPTWSRSVAYILDLPFEYEQGTIDVAYDNSRMKRNLYSENQSGILKCPTEATMYRNNWKTQNSTSYGWNTGGYGMGLGDNYFLSAAAATRDGYRRVQRTEVLNPTGTILLGEYINRNGLYDYVTSQFTGSDTRFATYHNGGSNVLWNDGHATPLKFEDMTLSMRRRTQ